MKLFKYTMLVAAVCAAFTLQSAKAVEIPFTSTLDVGNSDLTGNGFNPPYGTVTVTLSGQVATVTFTAAAGYEFGDGKAVDVQVNSSDFTPAILSDPDFKKFGSGQVDGFGDFNLQVTNNNFSTGFTLISFTLTNNSSTLWNSNSDVLAFNSSNFDAAAHMRSTVNNPTGITGFAGEGPGTNHTPDSGATAALLGLGLTSLAGLRARFGRR
jgi:uncharacterized protein YaiE (UPF0345 family)